MVHPLDRLVREYAVPVMSDAGFTRRGRDFRLGSASGDWVLLGFYPGLSLGDGLVRFGYMPAVGPAPMFRFFDPEGEPPSARNPARQERMFQLTGAEVTVDDFKDPVLSGWAFDPNTQLESCGKSLAEVLRAHTVPLLLRLLVRKNLIEAIRSGEPLGAFSAHTRMRDEFFCTVDTAPVPELEAMLAQVPERGEFAVRLRAFVRRELDARIAAAEG